MRKAALLIFLAVVSRGAGAEWVKVGDEGIAMRYADPATILRTGNMAAMWDLLDFKAVQSRPYGTPYLSQKTQQEYECAQGQARIVDIFRYSDNMAAGEEAHADPDSGQWKPASPGSTIENLLKFACK